MIFHFIIQGIFVLAGVTSVLAAIANWDWFFSTRSAHTIFPFRNATRKSIRLFYFILGILLILTAAYFYQETCKAFR